MDVNAIDIELKEFNYKDIENMALDDKDTSTKKDGEVDNVSINDISIWKAGQGKPNNCTGVTIKDKLDLNSLPSFLMPIGSSSDIREIYTLDSWPDSDNMSDSSSSMEVFDSLDDCINQSRQSETLSIASLIWGRPMREVIWDQSLLFTSTLHQLNQNQWPLKPR